MRSRQRDISALLLTDKEHNSNLMPWLRLQKAGLIRVDHTTAGHDDHFDLAAFEGLLKNGRVRLVSMAYTSNVTGYTIPAGEIIKIAHRYGALVRGLLELLNEGITRYHSPTGAKGLVAKASNGQAGKLCWDGVLST